MCTERTELVQALHLLCPVFTSCPAGLHFSWRMTQYWCLIMKIHDFFRPLAFYLVSNWICVPGAHPGPCVSWGSSWLWQLCRFSPFLMTLTNLRCTGQYFPERQNQQDVYVYREIYLEELAHTVEGRLSPKSAVQAVRLETPDKCWCCSLESKGSLEA